MSEPRGYEPYTIAYRLKTYYLSLREILKESFLIFRGHIRELSYLLLLVYLPVSLLSSSISLNMDLTVENTELLLRQFKSSLLFDLLSTLLVLIAQLVVAVLVDAHVRQVEGTGKVLPFSTIFYRGIRMWPRGFLAQAFILIGLYLCVLLFSSLLFSMAMIYIVLILIIIALIYGQMLSSLCACSSALHGHVGFQSIAYVARLFEGRFWTEMGHFALISLIGTVLPGLLKSLVAYLLRTVSQTALVFAVLTASGTLFSFFSVYSLVCGALIYLNLERVRTERQKQEKPVDTDPSRSL